MSTNTPTIDNPHNIQQGLLQPTPDHAQYISLQLKPQVSLQKAINTLVEGIDGLNTVIGLGDHLIHACFSGSNSDTQAGQNLLRENSRSFKSYSQTDSAAKIDIPSTQTCAWLWLRGKSPEDLDAKAQKKLSSLNDFFDVKEQLRAFTYRTETNGPARDLSGYEDGTENPKGGEALKTTFVQGAGDGINGSSFVVVQRWQHQLSKLKPLKQSQQDDLIGRHRDSNDEYDSAPNSAHVKRTAQESFSPEAFMLRRSMPWRKSLTDGSQEEGLNFVCAATSYGPFEAQLQRMIGLEDGIIDGLFTFSTPLTGSYYWCPPMHKNKIDLRALGFDTDS